MTGYSVFSVVAFEVPTTAKWNLLGGNDVAFYAAINALELGIGIVDDAIIARHISAIDKSNLTSDVNPYRFHVYRAAAQNTGSAAYSKITFDTEEYDTNNNFSSGTYTVPVTGIYHFDVNIGYQVNGTYKVAIYKNGTIVKQGATGFTSGSTTVSNGLSIDLALAQNDTIEIYVYGSGAAVTVGASDTYMSGHLISRT